MESEFWNCCVNNLSKDDVCPICGEKFYDDPNEKFWDNPNEKINAKNMNIIEQPTNSIAQDLTFSNIKLIDQSVKFIDSQDFNGIDGKIEYCGRVCYNSAHKMKIESFPGEYERSFLTQRAIEGHTSIFEHGRVKVDKTAFDFALRERFVNSENMSNEQYHFVLSRISIKDLKYYSVNVRDILNVGYITEDWTKLPEVEDYFTVEIVCNRAIANELVRHRVCSFSQASTRYIKYKDTLEFIRPFDEKYLDDFKRAFDQSAKIYRILIENSVAPQNARDVLGLGFATKLIMTATLDHWIGVANLRLPTAAHPQIRELMKMIFNLPQVKDKFQNWVSQRGMNDWRSRYDYIQRLLKK